MIDPVTRDYVMGSTGRISGMTDTQQLVYLAVATARGSSAMLVLGQELRRIKRMSANFEKRVESTLRDAVQHLVARRLIEVIDAYVVVVRPGVAQVVLRWRALPSSEPESTPVGEFPITS